MPDPTDTHIEPSPEMLTPAAAGPFAAMEAALAGETPPAPPQADPQPGDALPPPDSAPRAPEQDGATDPDDNAPPSSDPVKPDDKKTVEPTDPKLDDPAVIPPSGPEGPTKRPSDELGELPADAPVKTRERFEAMKTRYDEVATEREQAIAQTQKWVDTIQGTGANPEQFGMTLAFLTAANSGTPEGMRKAYEIAMEQITPIAKQLGIEIGGVVDPLEDHPDLKQRVEDTDLSRADALELAQARAARKITDNNIAATQTHNTQQAKVDAGLADVASFGVQMRATDPAYAAKTAAITPAIKLVVAELPPEKWVPKIRELYDGVAHITADPPPPPPPPSVDNTPLRPTGTPSAGAGMNKAPGNAFEAMDMALSSM